jgi:hypothetical protein
MRVNCHVREGSVFHLDGAQPHFSFHVCAYLDRVSFSLGGTRRINDVDPSFSMFFTSGYFLPGVCKVHCLSWNVQNLKDLRDRIVRAAECVTNGMLTSTWRETEYRLHVYRDIYGIHIEIQWTHKKLYEVQCLKMYEFLQHTLWF